MKLVVLPAPPPALHSEPQHKTTLLSSLGSSSLKQKARTCLTLLALCTNALGDDPRKGTERTGSFLLLLQTKPGICRAKSLPAASKPRKQRLCCCFQLADNGTGSFCTAARDTKGLGGAAARRCALRLRLSSACFHCPASQGSTALKKSHLSAYFPCPELQRSRQGKLWVPTWIPRRILELPAPGVLWQQPEPRCAQTLTQTARHLQGGKGGRLIHRTK